MAGVFSAAIFRDNGTFTHVLDWYESGVVAGDPDVPYRETSQADNAAVRANVLRHAERKVLAWRKATTALPAPTSAFQTWVDANTTLNA